MKKYIIAVSLLVTVFTPTLNAMNKKELYSLFHTKKDRVINGNVIDAQRAEGGSIAEKMALWVLLSSSLSLWSAAFIGGLSVAHSPGTINPIVQDPLSAICFSPAVLMYVPIWLMIGMVIFSN